MYMCRLATLSHVTELHPHDRTDAAKAVVECLKPGVGKSFANLILLKSIAHAEVVSTSKAPLIVADPMDPMKIEIAGCPVSAADIRNAYKKALQRSKQLLNQLLIGMRAPVLTPTDMLSDERSGEGMHAHPDLGIHRKIQASLLEHVLNDPEMKARFIASHDADGVEFVESEVLRYLRIYDEYIENLLMLIHIGSGMPARATELTTLTRLNGCTALRGLYVSHGRIFTLNCYNKTRSLKGLNTPVARFLDEQSSKLVLLDNLVIRPFVVLLATKLQRNPELVYWRDVFVRGGAGVTGADARNIFRKLFSSYSGREISFGQYRHVAKYFANMLGIEGSLFPDSAANDDPEDDQDFDMDFGEATQFGHTRAVGDQIYAIVAGEHSRLREHHLLTYRRASFKWHEFLHSQDHIHDQDRARIVEPDRRGPAAIIQGTTVIFFSCSYLTDI